MGQLIPLFWISGDAYPGFQKQGGSLFCMFHRLRVMDSSDSPPVQHLQAFWWPAWQLSRFTHIRDTYKSQLALCSFNSDLF